jgi:hypothetical protein
MNRELDGSEAGLLHYWKFNEGSGTNASDSASGADGTLSSGLGGLPAWVSSCEGGPEIAGTPKPLCYGKCLNVEAVCVSTTDLIYQFHDTTVSSIDAVYDNGVALTLDTAQINFETFITTTPTAGQYDSYAALGMVRLGSSPAGKITGDIQGNVTSAYVDSFGDIVTDIVTVRGRAGDLLVNPTDLDTAAFSAITGRPTGGMGIHIRQPENISSALDKLASSVGGYWGFTRASLLTVGIFGLPSTASGLTEITVDDDTFSISPIATSVPAYRIRVGYQRNYTVQSRDVAGAVSEARRDFLEKQVRESTFEDPGLLTAHPLARDLVLGDLGLMDAKADADAEARRQFKIYGRDAYMYSIETALQLLEKNVGDTILLKWDRYGLTSGKEFVITRLVYELGDTFGITADVWANESEIRITEASDTRITEDGLYTRITE